MTKQEYEEYQAIVDKELSTLTHLTPVYPNEEQECTGDCEPTDQKKCTCEPTCQWCENEVSQEPYFSWSNCEVCGRPESGDRYHANGINKKTEEVICFEVCPDCIYYAEYSQLDDMTMLSIKS